MSIKNLTPRLAEVGKIKIGGLGEERTAKNGNKYRLPVRYNHFVVTTTERDATGNLIPDKDIMKQLGKDPTEIPIKLLFDSIDMNFYTSYQYYHGKKCLCKGDGEKAQRWVTKDKKEPELTEIECNPDKCEYAVSGKCKVSGILSCLLTHFPTFGGCYRYRTHGWNAVNNILAALEFFKSNTNGVLQGLPLKLVMLKKATAEHGNINTVSLVLDNIEIAKMRQLALQEYKNRKALGVNMVDYETKVKALDFHKDTDPEDIVQEEFYPEIEDAEYTEPEKGVSADDLKKDLEKKSETEKKPEQEKKTEPEKKDEKKKAEDLF
jgi:hypothetical protein